MTSDSEWSRDVEGYGPHGGGKEGTVFGDCNGRWPWLDQRLAEKERVAQRGHLRTQGLR